MMDVGLVNDGPVGVDYRCMDEAVRTPSEIYIEALYLPLADVG